MTYLEFLAQWYNLPWVTAVAGGLLLALKRRLGPRGGEARADAAAAPRTSPTVLLVAAGVVGLTLNGAIHDFRVGSVGRWFPLVAVLAVASGWLIAWGGSRVRHRYVPPVRGVMFNQPGLEGREAVVLNAALPPGRTGRGRYRDEAGISHIVRIHLPADADAREVRFGDRVRLGAFDTDRGSYPVQAP